MQVLQRGGAWCVVADGVVTSCRDQDHAERVLAERTRRAAAGIGDDAEYALAALSPIEMFVLRGSIEGRGVRDMAGDSEAAAMYGREPSHQTVLNIRTRALARLGFGGDPQGLIERVQAAERADLAEAMLERSGRVLPGDLHHDPAEVAPRKAKRLRTAADELDALTGRLLQEADRNGGMLDAGRLDHYAREAARLEAAGRR